MPLVLSQGRVSQNDGLLGRPKRNSGKGTLILIFRLVFAHFTPLDDPQFPSDLLFREPANRINLAVWKEPLNFIEK